MHKGPVLIREWPFQRIIHVCWLGFRIPWGSDVLICFGYLICWVAPSGSPWWTLYMPLSSWWTNAASKVCLLVVSQMTYYFKWTELWDCICICQGNGWMLELYLKACITPGTSEWVGTFETEELSKLSLFTDKTGASQKRLLLSLISILTVSLEQRLHLLLNIKVSILKVSFFGDSVISVCLICGTDELRCWKHSGTDYLRSNVHSKYICGPKYICGGIK